MLGGGPFVPGRGGCPAPSLCPDAFTIPRNGCSPCPEWVFSFPESVFTMPGTGVQVGSESVFTMDRRTQFTAARAGSARELYALTLSGKERLVMRMAETMVLHDIAPNGRLLVAREDVREFIRGMAPGDSVERDLSYLDWSLGTDLSPDGKTLVFTEQSQGAGPHYAACLRGTDGSPTIRLGDGVAMSLSPDGQWVLAIQLTPEPRLVLLPTRAGEARSLARGALENYGWGRFVPDGKQIVFSGHEPGHEPRTYLQPIAGGDPQPITPEGVSDHNGLYSNLVSPDGRFVVIHDGDSTCSLYPLNGGPPEPIAGIGPNEWPLQWTPDGGALFVGELRGSSCRIHRLEIATGKRRSAYALDSSDHNILWPRIWSPGASCARRWTLARRLTSSDCALQGPQRVLDDHRWLVAAPGVSGSHVATAGTPYPTTTGRGCLSEVHTH